jgi:hypothetical protein
MTFAAVLCRDVAVQLPSAALHVVAPLVVIRAPARKGQA